MTATRILVLGGTGFVGRAVCEKLAARGGGAITVPTREASRHVPGTIGALPAVRIEQADVHDDRDLAARIKDHDVVINLVAILHGDEAEFDRVHVQLPRRVARLAAESGVKRIVHVSALGADPAAPSRYLRSKGRGEQQLQRDGGVPVTVLRPSVIFGAEDRFINLFAAMQSVLPLMPLAGAHARFQPVWVDDVAGAIVRSIDDASAAGATIECCGPDIFTLRELVHRAGEWSGHQRTVIALPDWIGRLQAMALEWLPGDPVMSRDNLDSMRVPNVASGLRPGLERLGIAPRWLESVMRPWLASRRREQHFALLRSITRRR